MSRKPYPSDASDAEWAFLAPYLTLMREDAPQGTHSLRELLDGVRYAAKIGCDQRSLPHDLRQILRLKEGRDPAPTAAILEGRVLRSTPESGRRAGYSGAKGGKVHLAVDTLGLFLALHVTPADVDEREAVGELARKIQEATGDSVELAWVDQGYTGPKPAEAAAAHGIRLEVVKLDEAEKGFVLLPRRWVVERSFAWSTRFRRLSKDYERLADTLAGLHALCFCTLMLKALEPWLVGAEQALAEVVLKQVRFDPARGTSKLAPTEGAATRFAFVVAICRNTCRFSTDRRPYVAKGDTFTL